MSKSRKVTVEEVVKALKSLTPQMYAKYESALDDERPAAKKVRKETVGGLLDKQGIIVSVSSKYGPPGYRVCHPQTLRSALNSMGYTKKSKTSSKSSADFKFKPKTTRPAPAAKVMVAKAFDSNELGDAVAALIESAQEIGYARSVKLLQVLNEENTEHHV